MIATPPKVAVRKHLVAADLFCGAGGTSVGLERGAAQAGYSHVALTAVNHWDTAIATHKLNHPAATHLCTAVDDVNPRHLFALGELDLLWASPECTHHSIARGGRPVNDQSRSTAMCVVRWAEAVLPKVILVENVPEFRSWGPLIQKTINGKKQYLPDPKRKGDLFRSWIAMLESAGYRVDYRVLCAADYGDPTTRERLFIQAVRGHRKIKWPDPTHEYRGAPSRTARGEPRRTTGGRGGNGSADLFGKTRKPWQSARSIIDWSDLGKSIYARKKPLAPKTMERIRIGLMKFGLGPFIVPQHSGSPGEFRVHSLDKPLATVTTDGGASLVTPFLVELSHDTTKTDVSQNHRVNSIEEPLKTVPASGNHHALVNPFLIKLRRFQTAASVDEPLGAVTTSGAHDALISPFLIGIDHQTNAAGQISSVADPLTTVTSKQRHALLTPHLTQYYGTGRATSVESPVPTVTANDRFALVQPLLVQIGDETYKLDILFRMLKPRELASAQGFPLDYQFSGNTTETVKQIGNAVPSNLAAALVRAVLE